MNGEMAEVIAAHGHLLGEGRRCRCGNWTGRDDEPAYATHVAEELTKAGYGLVDPLAAALADPEGHALVKAIHDRKAAR